MRVLVSNVVSDLEFGLYLTFNARDATPADTALLSTCAESRQVYLENVTNSLPNGFKSIIRYDADCTTIFIENFNELMEDCSIATAVRKGWRRQQWTRNIKKMAVPVRCFMGNIGEIWGTGDEGRGEFLKIFESLEEWKGATFKALGEACYAALMRGYSSFSQGTQKELEIYQSTFNQGYNVPKVSLMKLAN